MKRFPSTLCILLAALFAGCNGKTCKVEPPPSVVGTKKEIAAKAAASALGSGVSGIEAGGSYKNIVNSTYATVGQDDIAFYLLLQAANCESSRGHLAQADALIKAARQELARRHRAPAVVVASHPDSLTPTEKRVLAKSPLKEEIKTTIAAPDPSPSPAPKKKTSRKPKATPTATPTG
jgi:hypothetical protein